MLLILCGCKYCNKMAEHWPLHVTGCLITNSRRSLSVTREGTCSLLNFASNKSDTSCCFPPVHSASFIRSRLHHLSCHLSPLTPNHPCNFCCAPVVSVAQNPAASPLGAVSHLHVCCLKSGTSPSSASPLSYPSLKPPASSPASVPRLSRLLRGVYSPPPPPSINKQFLLSCHLSGLRSFLWGLLPSVRQIRFSNPRPPL